MPVRGKRVLASGLTSGFVTFPLGLGVGSCPTVLLRGRRNFCFVLSPIRGTAIRPLTTPNLMQCFRW